jgi:hypothetical protein
MLRRSLLTLIGGVSMYGVLCVLPVVSESTRLRSAWGTAADVFLRVLLVPFVTSMSLVILCDARRPVGWLPFAVAPMLTYFFTGSIFRTAFVMQQMPIWLLSVGASLAGARLGAWRRIANST